MKIVIVLDFLKILSFLFILKLININKFQNCFILLMKLYFKGNKIDIKNWELWSGSEISLSCGILISSTSLVFTFQGERVLMSRDLDLTFVGFVLINFLIVFSLFLYSFLLFIYLFFFD